MATFITGCRSTDEYKKLAETGGKYAEAVNQLLTASGEITIEASSEQLLREDRELRQFKRTITSARYK
uniref:hypothetical protein n=1 Tax=Hassallia byssoidea TaxID=482630 RepID=UPI001F24F897|nr:hypothetical protein [Hassalia byssoidea]